VNPTTRRVSVVIPCFRGERFIGDAIASVLSQEGAEVEVVVVDDGSPDASADVVEAIDDSRVRLLRHDRNRGIAAARNTGLGAVSGELVAFLDQDDLWLPGRLSAQLGELDRLAAGGVRLVFCDVVNRDQSGRQWRARARVPRRVHALDEKALLARLVAGHFVNLGSALVERSLVEAAGRFDESIRGGSDDFDIMLRLAQRTRFAHVARTLFVHRIHEWNYTDSQRMTDESLAAIDRVEARHPELRRAARIGRGRMVYRRAADLQVAGERRRAAADYRRALAHWPLQPRAWLGLALCAIGPVGSAAASLWIRIRRALR
jgi:glycosyltransferase involved in cell wall biosynthesis